MIIEQEDVIEYLSTCTIEEIFSIVERSIGSYYEDYLFAKRAYENLLDDYKNMMYEFIAEREE